MRCGLLAALLSVLASHIVHAADQWLVKDGKPLAEIVISETPTRSVRLAVEDLRSYVEKISGARLPVVTSPSGALPVQIYLGSSSHTDRLGVTADGLEFGACRIVSGDNWLVLIGGDKDFVPREPWARSNSDRVGGRLQSDWEKVAGGPWGVPNGGMYKSRQPLPPETGRPDSAVITKNESFEVWDHDERGSFNAVCEFLRRLGVRWYMPGEIGEVIPRMTDIPLPEVDETIRPDFEIRQFNIRFGTASHDSMMWAMRLGMRNPYGLMIAHGMHGMTQTEQILREHPDWFALYGGKRDTEFGKRLNHLCYSNEELFTETVKWARAQFDVYDFESVSIMPPDAYISICQCELCEGKDVPEMGARGHLSNHVWDFVNRVAREVGKTHPDRLIVCCAYGANSEAPTNIERLEPNVQVVIVGGRRPRSNKAEQQADVRRLRDDWLKKTDRPLMVFENYPFTDRGFYLPAFVADSLGESINETKSVSRGEDIWLTWRSDFDTVGVGFNHFQVYFTARMYWGGTERSASDMLDEYCRLFYGPSGDAMHAFFQYCEANWQEMETDADRVNTALKLFAAAQQQADSGSVYGKRLALIDEFLNALRSKAELLAQKRGPVPKLRTVWDPKKPIVIDGLLDDQYWVECPVSSTGSLRELQTGRQPVFGTSIKAGWDRGSLYFGIRCDEHPGEPLNVATTKDEDQSAWYGDLVEIEIATDSHSYYQLAVTPSGALIDLDRGADKNSWLSWQSQAEVATHVADDHWTVEIRIPVTEDDNDPLNQVVGRKPSQSLPWHFNVCRQRIRKNGSEYSAFSPTGTAGFHVPMKFAWFYDGRSHQFDEDESVTDYIIASRNAAALMQRRDYQQAIEAFVELAESDQVTELQKSDALEQAAAAARAARDLEQAEQLAARIPIKAVAATVQMVNVNSQRDWATVTARFGDTNLKEWPFWQIGSGAYARGIAWQGMKNGEAAHADFQLALEYSSDPRTRLSIQRLVAVNHETLLNDDGAALEAYLVVADSSTNAGSADYYYALQGAARILAGQKKFDDALDVLQRVDIEKLPDSWRPTLLLQLGEIQSAAGIADAASTLRKVVEDPSATKSQREQATQALHDSGR